MDTKIAIETLDLYYSEFHALKNINMRIPEKEITAFIGPSGCGKSTLLKSLNRMNDLIEGCRITGRVLLDNDDIYANDDVNLLRKRVGMVFQKPNPFPMSVYDNIAFGPRTHGVKGKAKLDDMVEEALRKAAIWDEVKDRLSQPGTGLSGGQQQRLCIARTIAVSPEVILMDEPCSALDPIATAKIEELISELSHSIISSPQRQKKKRRQFSKSFACSDIICYQSLLINPRSSTYIRPSSTSSIIRETRKTNSSKNR